MQPSSSSSTPSSSSPSAAGPILVWDAPVRVFHWLLVLCFAGAWLTSESERWLFVHTLLGYTIAGLVAFRLLWGLVGTRHARFASFVRGPVAAVRYLHSLATGRPEHHTGHNPAGALAVLALLLLAAGTTAAGWALNADLGGHWLEEVHEALASLMLGVVGVHLAGVVIGSLAHRENLVRAMFTGRKHGDPREGIRFARHGLAIVLVALVCGFWWWQWSEAPPDALQAPAKKQKHLDDDD